VREALQSAGGIAVSTCGLRCTHDAHMMPSTPHIATSYDGSCSVYKTAECCMQCVQHGTTLCSTLQRTATHCTTLHNTATPCNTLQHTATHRNTLQGRLMHCVHAITQCLYATRPCLHATTQHTATCRSPPFNFSLSTSEGAGAPHQVTTRRFIFCVMLCVVMYVTLCVTVRVLLALHSLAL